MIGFTHPSFSSLQSKTQGESLNSDCILYAYIVSSGAEADMAQARDNREKAHRKVGSRSSIGSVGELDAFSPAHSDALPEATADAPAPPDAAGC